MDVSYSRAETEISQLTTKAWQSGAPVVSQSHGEYRLVSGGSGSIAGALGRLVEQQVFNEDFGEHSPDLMAAEYGPYEERAFFVTIVDADGPVAVDRTTWSPDISQPTKTEVDLERTRGELRRFHGVGLDEPVWDATTVAIMPRARQCREMLGWLVGEISAHCCLATGAPYLGIIRHEFFRVLQMWMPPTQPLGGQSALRYLEVWSQPTFAPAGAVLTMTDGFFEIPTRAARSRLAAHNYRDDLVIDLTDASARNQRSLTA